TNTTYFIRTGAVFAGATSYAYASTSTLTGSVTASQVYQVYFTSVVVNWQPFALSPSSSTSEGYVVQTSTAADFSGVLVASSTTNVALSTLTLTGLDGSTTYYFRVGGINWNSVTGNFASAGSAVTSPTKNWTG